jgi:hypothetical protein
LSQVPALRVPRWPTAVPAPAAPAQAGGILTPQEARVAEAPPAAPVADPAAAPPPAAPAAAAEVPAIPSDTLKQVYIDRDDFMKEIGKTSFGQSISLDGRIVHNGFGPPLPYTMAADGSVRTEVALASTASPDVSAPAPVAPAPAPAPEQPAAPAPTTTPAPVQVPVPGMYALTYRKRLEAVRIPAGVPVTFAFNTGSAAIGIIMIAEWGDAPIMRNAVLSATPGGAPVGPGCESRGPSLSFNYFVGGGNTFPQFYPTLQPNTTYYVTVTAAQDGTVFADWH